MLDIVISNQQGPNQLFSNQQGPNQLFVNQGNESFIQPIAFQNIGLGNSLCKGVSVADFDNEGFDDVPDAIDANITAGTLIFHGIDLVGTPGPGCGFVAAPAVPVPATNWYVLFALMLALIVFTRKFAK